MKKLAIIGAQRMAKNYAVNAREMGVETFCFAWPKGAVAKDFVDHFYPISIFEIEQIVEVCHREKIDGVVSTSELTISVAAQVAAELGLNGIPVEIARTITDKYRNREVSQNVEGLHHPKFAKVRAPDDVAAKGLSYPIILKPTAEGGKRGISVVNSPDELAKAFAYAHGESKNGAEFIAEEFIAEGKEYSVETLSYCGKHVIIQVTEKISSGPPHCVELGHIQPARISKDMRCKIVDVLSRALTAIGYSNGPCHTEVKIVDGEIWLIEFNARPGGDFISYPLCDLSTGYGYLKGAIRIALGEFCFPADSDFVQSAAGVCFVTEQTKWLKPVFDVCESKPWCWRKNDVGDISSLSHNDCDGTNYFIWHCDHGFPDELVDFGALNFEDRMFCCEGGC